MGLVMVVNLFSAALVCHIERRGRIVRVNGLTSRWGSECQQTLAAKKQKSNLILIN